MVDEERDVRAIWSLWANPFSISRSDALWTWEKMLDMAAGSVSAAGQYQQASLTAMSRALSLMTHSYARLWGISIEDTVTPERGDRRFKDETWAENASFDLLKQAYLITAKWMTDVAEGMKEVDPALHKRTTFWTQQLVDAMSPTNFALTNPAVLQEIVRTGGANLVQGFQNFMADIQQGRVSQVPQGSFAVGKDLACTPGKVVFRSPLIELIQYSPSTEQVHEVPILVIPPWINKYYVMDMRPENSMYKYLVDAGFTVFTISWKNPDESILHLEWEDYMLQGPIEALEIVKTITGADQVNMVGYCLGGIMLEVTLAYLASTGDESVRSATYFAAHQDFTNVGDVDAFLSEPEVQFIEWLMETGGGYLDGRNMAATFNMLRANDLLWHYIVNNYLLGQQPPAFDLLYWNSDGTRIPGRVHSFLLRNFFLVNKLLEPGAIKLNGVGIDTQRITVPSYTIAGTRDHIVPWEGAFMMRELVGGPVRFILAEGGHIAGIINHPAKKKRAYYTSDSDATDPQEWLESATRHEGSWWVDWVPWLEERSGETVDPPPMGNDEFQPIMDAPGTYVLER
jgi:polyhydroxyalkanoate synthase